MARLLTYQEMAALRPDQSGEDRAYPDLSSVPASQLWLAGKIARNGQGPFSAAGLAALSSSYLGGAPIQTDADYMRVLELVRADLSRRAEGERDRSGVFQNHKDSWRDLVGPVIVALALGGTVAGVAGAFGSTAAAAPVVQTGATAAAESIAIGGAIEGTAPLAGFGLAAPVGVPLAPVAGAGAAAGGGLLSTITQAGAAVRKLVTGQGAAVAAGAAAGAPPVVIGQGQGVDADALLGLALAAALVVAAVMLAKG